MEDFQLLKKLGKEDKTKWTGFSYKAGDRDGIYT